MLVNTQKTNLSEGLRAFLTIRKNVDGASLKMDTAQGGMSVTDQCSVFFDIPERKRDWSIPIVFFFHLFPDF